MCVCFQVLQLRRVSKAWRDWIDGATPYLFGVRGPGMFLLSISRLPSRPATFHRAMDAVSGASDKYLCATSDVTLVRAPPKAIVCCRGYCFFCFLGEGEADA